MTSSGLAKAQLDVDMVLHGLCFMVFIPDLLGNLLVGVGRCWTSLGRSFTRMCVIREWCTDCLLC